jgi:hypothetical protein
VFASLGRHGDDFVVGGMIFGVGGGIRFGLGGTIFGMGDGFTARPIFFLSFNGYFTVYPPPGVVIHRLPSFLIISPSTPQPIE